MIGTNSCIFCRLVEIAKKRFFQIYFCLLFILLVFLYFPSFFYPPRSDHWTAFYFFHNIEGLRGFYKWKEVVLYDPLINTTFRPVSFLILYFEHLVFNAKYIYYQFVNFGLYFISIFLFYKLAINFCKDRLLVIAFLTLFACSFSHFDLICWPYQFLIISSFCLFILGFILYMHYLKSARKIILLFVAISFISGMLLYEVFLFWPLAIVILTYIDEIVNTDKFKKVALRASYLSVLALTYIPYSLLFLLNRALRAPRGPSVPLDSLFSLRPFIFNGFIAFFNILYNNFLINLVPWLAFPLKTDENLNLGGFITRHELILEKIIFFGGS